MPSSLRVVLLVSIAVAASCGSSGSNGGSGGAAGAGGTGSTGQSCAQPTDCYPGLDGGATKGTVTCLKVQGGYCTHTCQTDADCCAVPGECKTGYTQVCSPFQSTGQTYCFLSCEAPAVGAMDPVVYCQSWANPTFTCRSTGGGATNRKICAP